MPPNRYATADVLAEIRRLKRELSERECRKRAERMAHQHSAEGRAEMVERLRKILLSANPLESSPTG